MQYKLPPEIEKLMEDAKSRCQSAQEVHNLVNGWSIQTILGHIHHLEVNSPNLKSVFLIPYYTLLASSLQAILMGIIYNRHFAILNDSRKAEKEMKTDAEGFWKDVMSFVPFAETQTENTSSKKKK